MSPETRTVMAFAADVLFKATLLIGFAGLVRLLLRRASASLRQAIGVFALGGILLLPALAPMLPDWKVPVIPSLLQVPEEQAEPARGRIERAVLVSDEPSSSGAQTATALETQASAARARSLSAERTADFGYGVVAEPEVAPAGHRGFSIPWPSAGTLALALLILWAAGAAALFLRLAAGIFRVSRVARSAEPAADPKWTELGRELSERLGLRRPVTFLFSDRVSVAVTSGFFRPVLLLPQSARRWSLELRRVVVLHELAHVRRGDWVALLLAETGAALYWFHPLVWIAVRNLRRDSEQAADDLVLRSGTKPSVYAGHLLGIIRSLRDSAPPALPVMGVARPSQFEARLKAILDPAASRREASAGQMRLAAGFAATAVLALGALQPWKSAEASAMRPLDESSASAPIAEKKSCETTKDDADTEKASEVLAELPEDADFAQVTAVYAEVAPEAEIEPEDPIGKPGREGNGEAFPAIYEYEKAKEQTGFVKAGRKQGRDGNDWYSQGMSHHHDEDYDAAIAAFQKSIEAGFKEGASSYNIACGYALKGNADRAFEWLDKAMEEGFDVAAYLGHDDDLDSLHSDPRWATYRQKARDSRGDSKRREAERKVAKFERLTQTNPKNGAAWYKVGYELYELEEYDRAAKAFQQAAQLGHQESTSLYNAACMLSLKGDRRAALDYLERAILGGFGSAEKLRQDDDLDNIRSEPRYRELVKLAKDLEMPDLHWSDKWPGRKSSRLRAEWKEAADETEAVTRQYPKVGRAWFNLGFARIKAGQAEEAVRAFEKALERNHRRATTMYNLACSYALLDRKDQAFDWLFKAIEAGFDADGTIRQDEDLDNLRGDPRYRQAIKLADSRDSDDHDDD